MTQDISQPPPSGTQHARLSKEKHDSARHRGVAGVRPVAAKWPIGTEYGVRSDIWAAGYHTGIDYLAPLGTLVRSARAGRVVYIGRAGWYGDEYGLHVVVETEVVQALYAHLRGTSDQIKVGRMVERGERLGMSGQSGHTFGAHLHFEVREDPYGYGRNDFSPHIFLASGWRAAHHG